MVKKSLIIQFTEGCLINPELGGGGFVAFKVFRKGSQIWAEPDIGEEKIIVKSPTLKAHDLWKTCTEFTIAQWTKEGKTVLRCPRPKGKRQRANYTKAFKQRTWAIRRELTEAGVLSK